MKYRVGQKVWLREFDNFSTCAGYNTLTVKSNSKGKFLSHVDLL